MAAVRVAATIEPDAPIPGVSGSIVSAPTYTRPCNNASNHQPHNYYKRWHKRLLPALRDPDSYPEVWDSPYRCPGVCNG